MPLVTKNARRRAKRKQAKAAPPEPAQPSKPDFQSAPGPSPLVSVAPPEIPDELADQFAHVLDRYQPPDSTASYKGDILYSDDDVMSESDDEDDETPLSRKHRRLAQRMSVAELKQIVRKPEIVEWVDVASHDPQLLIHLKGYRNAVPIPSHWSSKKDYLALRKGVQKLPYELPSYIAETGIAGLRDAMVSADANKTLKTRTRERVQPKLGRMDIDYQKLHDAFFRFQTRPPLSQFGDIYFEGKELQTRSRTRRPGELSAALKEALSIPPLAPPPWLIAMQRYGPPPSYPHMRIPGLNAPIPPGAQWGFHPGGWGRPPLDESGQPLYGDVFHEHTDPSEVTRNAYDPIEREEWGEVFPDDDDVDEDDLDDEEEEEEEEDAEVDDDEPQDEAAHEPMDSIDIDSGTASVAAGLETPSGIASVAAGLETPDHIELRKDPSKPQQLYQVIPEREAGAAGRGFLGSEHLYELPPN
ncbi:hypothetical protein MCUN1_003947 [Malassezia cuniculi]|uniref:PSP proline-rich domain-containing protein n=1 Tax=Malassezia cuniculi TaxID=948313 RepID=A0AAF0EXU6_9BASI|nr:hypothetical protein MCUN1_003947 [Malassezia cuniculi]